MEKKNKIILIIVSVIIVLVIIGIGALMYNSNQYNKTMAKKCINYPKDWLWVIDCYGVVTINHAFDIEGYYFYDHVHDYELARIDSLDDYKFNDGFIYVKNRTPLRCSVVYNNGDREFCHEIFQGGKKQMNNYKSQLDIPLYLIIETQTGEVSAYKTIDEVPEVEREKFQELENKQDSEKGFSLFQYGTEGYNKKVELFDIKPDQAYNLVIGSNEPSFKVIRSGEMEGLEAYIESPTDPEQDSKFLLQESPYLIIEDDYFFTTESKSHPKLTGYYVNGHTGEVEFRVSDRIMSGALFDKQSDNINADIFTKVEILEN